MLQRRGGVGVDAVITYAIIEKIRLKIKRRVHKHKLVLHQERQSGGLRLAVGDGARASHTQRTWRPEQKPRNNQNNLLSSVFFAFKIDKITLWTISPTVIEDFSCSSTRKLRNFSGVSDVLPSSRLFSVVAAASGVRKKASSMECIPLLIFFHPQFVARIGGELK